MRLFEDLVPEGRQHPIYKRLKQDRYGAERSVLEDWADGFLDRDGKFRYEFQTTFEPCLWELYLHAFLRHIGVSIDFSFASPDFVVSGGQEFCIEATIAAPPAGGKPACGYGLQIPDDFNEFNSEATLRICNSFSSKVKRYRDSYSRLPHCKGKPFVVAVASFDRPFSHFAAARPVISALYGLYHDEELTLSTGAANVISYNVDSVVKNESVTVPVGYFADDSYSDVSAGIYSSLATWGKVRALANNPDAKSVYTTFHPNPTDIRPIVRQTPKAEYTEHLLDGLYIFHNPFATRPLHPATLAHSRLAQVFVQPDGELRVEAPDDFLLVRFLLSK